jgi:hypothetical protein
MPNARSTHSIQAKCAIDTTPAAVGLLAGITVAGQTAASAANPTANRAPAQHWSQITALGSYIIKDIGLVRGSDGVLHVLWTEGGTGRESIIDTAIGPGGSVFPRVTIISGQYSVTGRNIRGDQATAWRALVG